MASDYYSPSEDESSTAPEGDAAETTPGDDSPESNTALLPKSFFKDKELEVGKECKVRIEHVFEDEVEVSYVEHDDTSNSSMDDSMAGIDSLAGETP